MTVRAGDAGAALRAAGLRVTRPRRLVLDTLERLGGHRSADDVAAALADTGERLSRMSVYNALDALTGAGLLAVVDTGPGPARYELAEGPAHHHHFVCRRCGSITDVPRLPREPKWSAVAVRGAVVERAEVILRGLCTQCEIPNVR